MNKKISKLLEDLITECECDNRIETGIFDIYNTEHLVVLSEHMTSHGISESVIEDAIQSMVDEGKYPERQAYNKEGWLVTFPSKEYRDAAIKKKTHFSSDPTHGKGGMNLYYKKKGKQKRQTAQAQTSTGGGSQPPSKAPVAPKAAQPQQADKQTQPSNAAPTGNATPDQDEESEDEYILRRSAELRKNWERIKASQKEEPPASATNADDSRKDSSGTPSIDVPVVTQAPQEYATVSKKFAIQKGWKAAEYGEYHDLEGNPIAVVGLSGEIVPIRSNDREEYKIFAEKNMPS